MSRRSALVVGFFGSAAAAGNQGKLGNLFGLGMPDGHGHDGNMTISAQGFGGDGTVMQRVYTKYAGLPVGAEELKRQGWTRQNTKCDQHLGYAWTQDRRGPTRTEPMILYTTEDGLPAGVGTMIRKFMPEAQKKWTTQNPLGWSLGNHFQVDVAFRRSDVCKQGAGHSGIGDALIVNPGGAYIQEIPLTYQKPWVKGACFDGMGFHAFLNTESPDSSFPWSSSDQFPVVAMYNGNIINAIFFASVTSQVSIPLVAANWWEPVSLSNDAMCGNYCDGSHGSCGFTGNGAGKWSTMHVYFNDYKTVKCPADWTCTVAPILPGRRGCCPSARTDKPLPLGQDPAPAQSAGIVPFLAAGAGVGVLVGGFVAWMAPRRQRMRAPTEVEAGGVTI